MPSPAHSGARTTSLDRALRRALLILVVSVVLPAPDANGQAIDRPADDRPELPEFEAPGQPEPILLPLPPTLEPRRPQTSGLGAFVTGFRIVGSTVFSDEVLQEAGRDPAGVKRYIGPNRVRMTAQIFDEYRSLGIDQIILPLFATNVDDLRRRAERLAAIVEAA